MVQVQSLSHTHTRTHARTCARTRPSGHAATRERRRDSIGLAHAATQRIMDGHKNTTKLLRMGMRTIRVGSQGLSAWAWVGGMMAAGGGGGDIDGEGGGSSGHESLWFLCPTLQVRPPCHRIRGGTLTPPPFPRPSLSSPLPLLKTHTDTRTKAQAAGCTISRLRWQRLGGGWWEADLSAAHLQ